MIDNWRDSKPTILIKKIWQGKLSVQKTLRVSKASFYLKITKFLKYRENINRIHQRFLKSFVQNFQEKKLEKISNINYEECSFFYLFK